MTMTPECGCAIDGYAPKSVTLHSHYCLDRSWTCVVHADPYAVFTNDLLCEIHSGVRALCRLETDGHTHETLCVLGHANSAGHLDCGMKPCFHDALLHIDASNQHVVYRIGKYLWEQDCWEARWPD